MNLYLEGVYILSLRGGAETVGAQLALGVKRTTPPRGDDGVGGIQESSDKISGVRVLSLC